ncbi:hypothetical protein VK792_14305 [Mesobacterium sp. TK19101]|uniref:Uncharacterized protein n=1 Tax=Mesobacterium hydrothermale TaxID=3111907 RepID=A0ABU6HKQ8_9RHOB|nr:hypothetical protein [Mesobacterium sp. TK19101]MEC3862461.1 hypothetical protein [Mesobacterium sp. TK19101]
MTDLSDPRALRSPVEAHQRSQLSATPIFPLYVTEALWKLMSMSARRLMSSNARTRAERALLAQRMRETSRRKVDRLMM